jgi:hypothetical protein
VDKKISGKKVVLRDKLTGRQSWGILRVLQRFKGELPPFDDFIEIAKRMIVSWEFEGSPQKKESYDALLPEDALPLFEAMIDAYNALSTPSKN